MSSTYKKSTYTKRQVDSLIAGVSGGSAADLTELAAASGGWNSTYTTVFSNSGLWSTGVNPTSAFNWNNTYTTVNSNSAIWSSGVQDLDSVLTQGASSSHGMAIGDATTQDMANNPRSIFVGDSITRNQLFPINRSFAVGENIAIGSNRNYLIGGNITTSDIHEEIFIINADDTDSIISTNNEQIKMNYGIGGMVITGPSRPTYEGTNVALVTDLSEVSAVSGNWNSVYTNVNSNSADWANHFDSSEIATASGGWNSTETTVNVNSANWNSTYTTVNTTSSTWVNPAGITARTGWLQIVNGDPETQIVSAAIPAGHPTGVYDVTFSSNQSAAAQPIPHTVYFKQDGAISGQHVDSSGISLGNWRWTWHWLADFTTGSDSIIEISVLETGSSGGFIFGENTLSIRYSHS